MKNVLLATTATYPQEDWGLVFATVLIGVVVVFIILSLLIFVFWLLGKIMTVKPKPQKLPPPVLAPAKAVEAPAPTQKRAGEPEEIVAVIAAAVAAIGEGEGKKYIVRDIKKREKPLRSTWRAAGIEANTRPFVNLNP